MLSPMMVTPLCVDGGGGERRSQEGRWRKRAGWKGVEICCLDVEARTSGSAERPGLSGLGGRTGRIAWWAGLRREAGSGLSGS